MTVVHIKIKRPILRLASKNNGHASSPPKKQTWNKPKVTEEIKCQGVSPTHVSKLN
jgi:hypothetical protein